MQTDDEKQRKHSLDLPLPDSVPDLDARVARMVKESIEAEPAPPDMDSRPEPVTCPECGQPVIPAWVGRVPQGNVPFWFVDDMHQPCRQVKQIREDLARVRAERRERFIAQLREDAGIDIGDYKQMRFENYEPVHEMQIVALSIAKRFIERMKEAGRDDLVPGIWLWSAKNGIGKTHLAIAVLDAVLNMGRTAYILVEPELVKNMRDGFGASNKESEALREIAAEAAARAQQQIAWAKEVDVLLLDDMGRGHIATASGSRWVQDEVYFPILDERYRRQRTTIVTSNFDPDVVSKRMGTANADRLLGMCPYRCEMQGESRRRKA